MEQTERKGYYALEAWFRNGDGSPRSIYSSDVKGNDFKLKDLPSVIDDILYKHDTNVLPVGEKLAAYREQFTIEFFLPIQLLNEPVEQWKLPSTGRMLGVDHRLVIRFCDFIPAGNGKTKATSWLHDLQFLCREHPDVLSNLEKSGINWLEQFDPTKEEHTDKLHEFLHNGKLFVILQFPLDKKSFLRLIRPGTPFLFWARCWDDSEKECLRQKFEELLEDCKKLEELPEVLMKKRRKTVSECRTNGMSMICNLSLFWNKHDKVLSLIHSKLTAPDSQ